MNINQDLISQQSIPDPNVNLKVINVAREVQKETTIEFLNNTIEKLTVIDVYA